MRGERRRDVRLMRALANVGVFEEREGRIFALVRAQTAGDVLDAEARYDDDCGDGTPS